jgi:hypothetical protein
MKFHKSKFGWKELPVAVAAVGLLLPLSLLSPCLCLAASSSQDVCCGEAENPGPQGFGRSCCQGGPCCDRCGPSAAERAIAVTSRSVPVTAAATVAATVAIAPQTEGIGFRPGYSAAGYQTSPLRLHALLGVWLN